MQNLLQKRIFLAIVAMIKPTIKVLFSNEKNLLNSQAPFEKRCSRGSDNFGWRINVIYLGN
jgi:hypothetical protein